jgi:hypothetical protein
VYSTDPGSSSSDNLRLLALWVANQDRQAPVKAIRPSPHDDRS